MASATNPALAPPQGGCVVRQDRARCPGSVTADGCFGSTLFLTNHLQDRVLYFQADVTTWTLPFFVMAEGFQPNQALAHRTVTPRWSVVAYPNRAATLAPQFETSQPVRNAGTQWQQLAVQGYDTLGVTLPARPITRVESGTSPARTACDQPLQCGVQSNLPDTVANVDIVRGDSTRSTCWHLHMEPGGGGANNDSPLARLENFLQGGATVDGGPPQPGPTTPNLERQTLNDLLGSFLHWLLLTNPQRCATLLQGAEVAFCSRTGWYEWSPQTRRFALNPRRLTPQKLQFMVPRDAPDTVVQFRDVERNTLVQVGERGTAEEEAVFLNSFFQFFALAPPTTADDRHLASGALWERSVVVRCEGLVPANPVTRVDLPLTSGDGTPTSALGGDSCWMVFESMPRRLAVALVRAAPWLRMSCCRKGALFAQGEATFCTPWRERGIFPRESEESDSVLEDDVGCDEFMQCNWCGDASMRSDPTVCPRGADSVTADAVAKLNPDGTLPAARQGECACFPSAPLANAAADPALAAFLQAIRRTHPELALTGRKCLVPGCRDGRGYRTFGQRQQRCGALCLRFNRIVEDGEFAEVNVEDKEQTIDCCVGQETIDLRAAPNPRDAPADRQEQEKNLAFSRRQTVPPNMLAPDDDDEAVLAASTPTPRAATRPTALLSYPPSSLNTTTTTTTTTDRQRKLDRGFGVAGKAVHGAAQVGAIVYKVYRGVELLEQFQETANALLITGPVLVVIGIVLLGVGGWAHGRPSERRHANWLFGVGAFLFAVGLVLTVFGGLMTDLLVRARGRGSDFVAAALNKLLADLHSNIRYVRGDEAEVEPTSTAGDASEVDDGEDDGDTSSAAAAAATMRRGRQQQQQPRLLARGAATTSSTVHRFDIVSNQALRFDACQGQTVTVRDATLYYALGCAAQEVTREVQSILDESGDGTLEKPAYVPLLEWLNAAPSGFRSSCPLVAPTRLRVVLECETSADNAQDEEEEDDDAEEEDTGRVVNGGGGGGGGGPRAGVSGTFRMSLQPEIQPTARVDVQCNNNLPLHITQAWVRGTECDVDVTNEMQQNVDASPDNQFVYTNAGGQTIWAALRIAPNPCPDGASLTFDGTYFCGRLPPDRPGRQGEPLSQACNRDV